MERMRKDREEPVMLSAREKRDDESRWEPPSDRAGEERHRRLELCDGEFLQRFGF
jgi:hypothetical protein